MSCRERERGEREYLWIKVDGPKIKLCFPSRTKTKPIRNLTIPIVFTVIFNKRIFHNIKFYLSFKGFWHTSIDNVTRTLIDVSRYAQVTSILRILHKQYMPLFRHPQFRMLNRINKIWSKNFQKVKLGTEKNKSRLKLISAFVCSLLSKLIFGSFF